MELYIGNRNYSSWSMRPWLVLEHSQIPFQEVLVPFDDFRADQAFKATISKVSPTAKVPTLLNDNMHIWDSLAICEYLAELYPDKALWPADLELRTKARSICAEMHSGFPNLRTLCGMNIEADLAEVGERHWAEHEKLRLEVNRIESIWASRSSEQGFLFVDTFSIADAFYAPVVMRFISYQLPVSTQAQLYMQTILNVPAVQKWIELAKKEHRFVPNQEPYRTKR